MGGLNSSNNANGITVLGTPNTETVTLTNRFQVSATFSDNAVHELLNFPLGAMPRPISLLLTLLPSITQLL